MTKAEELNLFKEFYSKLPDGYLKEILRGMDEQLKWLIDNDFVFSLADYINDLCEERKGLIVDINDLKEKVKKLTAELKAAEENLQIVIRAKKKAADELRQVAIMIEQEG